MIVITKFFFRKIIINNYKWLHASWSRFVDIHDNLKWLIPIPIHIHRDFLKKDAPSIGRKIILIYDDIYNNKIITHIMKFYIHL